MEEWKDIPWYERLYQISNIGRVKSLARQKGFLYQDDLMLKLRKKDNWYYSICLRKDNKSKYCHIHRLVMLTFVWENKLWVNHKDWDKSNNKVENLEYCTHSENHQHRFKVLWHIGNQSKKVNQLDLDWRFIKTWISAKKACEYMWLSRSVVTNCIKWRLQTAWGYKWEYFHKTTT